MDEFLDEVSKAAKVQYWSDLGVNQERYVANLSALARRLNLLDPRLCEVMHRHMIDHGTIPDYAELHKDLDFQVSLIYRTMTTL